MRPLLMLSLLLGCDPDAGVTLDVTAEVTDVPTVVRVSWTDEGATSGEVAWETPQGSWVVAAEDLGDGSFEALLVGARPETEITLTVTSGGVIAEPVTVTTGEKPDWAPSVDTFTGETSPYLQLLGIWPEAPENWWIPVVLDGEGEPIWWFDDEETENLGTLRVMPDPNGEGIWFSRFGMLLDADPRDDAAAILHVDWDGTVLRRISAPGTHHDFHLDDEGNVYYIEYDVDEAFNGDEAWGDRLVKVAPDETETEIWSTWDQFDYDPQTAAEDEAGLWTHSNHLSWNGESLLLGIRNLGAMVSLTLDGEVEWVMAEGFDIEPEVVYEDQHGANWTDDGSVLIYDNQSASAVRILELMPNEVTGEADLIWEYVPEPARDTVILGDVSRTDDELTRVTFGLLSEQEAVDVDGNVVSALTMEGATMLGYPTFVTSIGGNEPQ